MKNRLMDKKILLLGAVLLVAILILICVIVRCSGEKKSPGSDTENNPSIEIDQTGNEHLETDESETTMTDDEIDYETAFDAKNDSTQNAVENEGSDDNQDDDKNEESAGNEGDDKKDEPTGTEGDDDNFDVSETAPGGFGELF